MSDRMHDWIAEIWPPVRLLLAIIGLSYVLCGCAIYPNGNQPQQQPPTTIIEPQQQQQQPTTTYVTPYRAYPMWLIEQMVECVPGTRCDAYAPQYHHEQPYYERCVAQCQEHRRYVQHQQWLHDHGYRE
jgi:hypothetical protein